MALHLYGSEILFLINPPTDVSMSHSLPVGAVESCVVDICCYKEAQQRQRYTRIL